VVADLILILMVITLILFIILAKVKTNTVKNVLTCYLVYWGGWILISLSNPYGLDAVSDKTYLLIWLNLFFFSIGYLMFCKKINTNKYSNLVYKNNTYKLFVIVQVIVLFVLFYYLIKYNILLKSTVITDARKIKFELGFLFGSYAESLVYNYFIETFLYLSVIINIGIYLATRKKNISLFINIISIFIFAFTGLGRFVFWDIFIFVFVAIYIKKEDPTIMHVGNNCKRYTERKRSNSKLIYVLYSFLFIFFMTLITSIRTGASILDVKSFVYWLGYSIKQGVLYLTGPFRVFDFFINNKIYDNIGYTLGRATFAGIDEIVNNLFMLLGLNIKSANYLMSSFIKNPVYIGGEQTFSIFYPVLMNFYLDGGVFYVIIFAFLYGAISAKIWNLYNESPNLFTYSLLIFFVKTTIASQYRWDFIAPSNCIIIIVLIILSIKNKKYNIDMDSVN
jgi:oligosaccharide repeat unit polymerase